MRGTFGYALGVLIDKSGGAGLDVEATPAGFAEEVGAERDMLTRAANRFSYRPKRIAADKAYGSAAFSPSCTIGARCPYPRHRALRADQGGEVRA